MTLDLDPTAASLLALGRPGTHPAGAVVGVLADGTASVASAGWAVAPQGDSPGRPMTADTWLDLASVTKVASTTALAMRLAADGSLDLEQPVATIIPGFGGGTSWGGATRVRHLLEHTSGLPPWLPLYCRTTDRDEALALAASVEPVSAPGTRWVYSDLGMVVMGAVLETVAGRRQDVLFADLVAGPLGLGHAAYRPSQQAAVAASADSDVTEHEMVGTGEPYPTDARVEDFTGWRDELVVGAAGDGNTAHALGGVAGHAGLFATVPDLLRIGRALVDPALIPEAVLDAFTRPLATAPGRALGFRLTTTSVGGQRVRLAFHPGFTGTWLGVALDRDLVVAVGATRLHTTTGTISAPLSGRSQLVMTDQIAATTLVEVGAALAAGGHPLPTGAT